jgi:hypothetical protein
LSLLIFKVKAGFSDGLGKDFIPYKDYMDFIHSEYKKDLKKELSAYPPTYKPKEAPQYGKGKSLRSSWKATTVKIDSDTKNTEIVNTKTVDYQGKSWNLLDLLHNGTKPYRANPNNPTGLMTFFWEGQWRRVKKVKGIDEKNIGGHTAPYHYNISKMISASLTESWHRMDREIRLWQPPR